MSEPREDKMEDSSVQADPGTAGSPGDEHRHVFDNPANVRLLLRVFYVICALLVLVEFVFHRHVSHPFENLFGFYAVYGFAACVALVLIAKQMRKVLMRDEDYYERGQGE